MRPDPGRLAGLPTILLVDDEPDVRESILDLLQSAVRGARVLSCATAEEGLAILGRSHVDVVVSDYKLPGMDGLRFLQEAQRLAPAAPRILITAYAELEVAVEAVDAARIEAVVTKPLDAADLLARVRAALAAAPAQASLAKRYVRDA